MVAQIPNFWPLVLEQAPLDIDQYIQPSDSALLLSSLKSLSVSHFQIPATTPDADPRSFSIRMEFGPNDYFEDEVLEKKFWHRTAKDGWNGLVSEPVPIKWKKGKDLTAGALDLAVASYKAERARDKKATGGNEELTEESKALKKKIESTSVGGISFFAWFGYHGPNVSAGESVEATKLEAERRERSKKGEKTVDEAEVEPEDDPFLDLEIFHDGDELAVAIKEDLWPDAIKYFSKLIKNIGQHVSNEFQPKLKSKTHCQMQTLSLTMSQTNSRMARLKMESHRRRRGRHKWIVF